MRHLTMAMAMGVPARMDLLLVEDDDADRALVDGMFRRARKLTTTATGVRLHRATNLLEAERVLEAASPGSLAVLLDLSLADATEGTTLDWIRRNALLFPLIVLTGNDDDGFPEKALRAGAQDYLVKWEFDADSLARAILYATERHRTQDELRRAKDAAEAASRAKSEFLANMSHEIRTPLGAMLGAVELLGESSLSPEQRAHVEMLSKAGRHLRELVDEVLDLAKVEAGGVVLERVGFALDDLLGEIEGLLRAPARAKGLHLSCAAPAERLVVWGDPTRLKQVLLNLVGNAVKFTERGAIDVRAERVGPDDGGHVRFSVADTGIGIAPDQVPRIFGAFTQADTSTTRLHGGTGLGLTIASRLVGLMGGRLEVESTVGAGSRFSFTIALPPADRTHAIARSRTDDWASLSTAAHRVLIADDAEDNRVLLARFLKDTPFELAFATDGADALDQYRRLQPGVVLLDLHMPRLDGIEVARRIRQAEDSEGRAPVALIALTADAFNQTRDRCLTAGFTTFLTKPVAKAALREAIAQALRSGAHPARPTPDHQPERLDEGPAPRVDQPFDEDLRDLLPTYVRNRFLDAEAIRAALAERDLGRVAELAHRMRGSGATYGLPIVTEVGARMEAAAEQGRTDLLPAELERLARELLRLRERLGPTRP